MKRETVKALMLLVAGGVAFSVWRFTPIGQHLTLQNAGALSQIAENFGPMAPILYVFIYGIGAVLMVPGSILSVVGALSFGVFVGTLVVSFGSTLGAALAFLVARYLARPWVERIIAKQDVFKKIDDGVKKHGWRMVAITRLLPFFPYVLINFAYGLTKVRFSTYVAVTFVTMLPINFAICLAAGSLVSGNNDWKKIVAYMLAAGVLFTFLTLLPLLLKRRLPADLVKSIEVDSES